MEQQLQHDIRQAHAEFTGYLATLDETAYCRTLPGKWTAGQHLEHILKSVAAVNRGIANPQFMQPVEPVIPARNLLDLAGLLTLYRQKAGNGATAPPPFVPGEAAWLQREQLFTNLDNAVSELCRHITDMPAVQLDGFALPHPLLGWLSLREMIYFTIFHCGHHFELAKKAAA